MSKNKVTKLQLQLIRTVLRKREKLREELGFDALYNNKHREILQEDLLNRCFHNGFMLTSKCHGADIVNKTMNIVNGELKGAICGKCGEHNRKKLSEKENMFWGSDKMNDPIKRDQIYDNDFWCFTGFYKEEPVVSFIISNKDGLSRLHKLFDLKIISFIELEQKCKRLDKRVPRDHIQISLSDLLTFNDKELTVIVNDQTILMSEYKELINKNTLYSDFIDGSAIDGLKNEYNE